MALSVKQQALTRGKFDDFHQADDMRITSYALRYYLNTPESNCPASYPVDVTTRIQKSGASWPVGKWKTDVESDLKGINRMGSRLRVDSRLYNPDTNVMNNTPLQAAPATLQVPKDTVCPAQTLMLQAGVEAARERMLSAACTAFRL